MNEVTILTIDGQEIQLMTHKGEIGYSMQLNGKHYGVRVPLKSRKVLDIATAIALLVANVLDTKKALDENK